MGQEVSQPIDPNVPPQTLARRDIESAAALIKDGGIKRIVVMTGAGISTSAGIPDFRSPDTGLYANLARLNLPFAEAVFDISYFRENPLPFYAIAQELFPGKFRPTITHSFISLLYQKGLLLKLFTQNVDCLERAVGIPPNLIVEAHGSFANQRCIECGTEYPMELMHKAIQEKTIPHCLTPQCGGLVKPDIVFFGEQLPSDFFVHETLPAQADLCIVLGTSLSVQPFASLPSICSNGTPRYQSLYPHSPQTIELTTLPCVLRILINQEIVGGLGSRADDVLLLGDCDSGVRTFAAALGWLEELEALWATTAPEEAEAHATPVKPRSKDEQLADKVATLSAEVDDVLKLSETHRALVHIQLEKLADVEMEAAIVQKEASAVPVPEDDIVGMEENSPAPQEDAQDTRGKNSEVTVQDTAEFVLVSLNSRPNASNNHTSD
ncbi:MAG: Sir2 histone deacetylase Hst2 [Trizodia sp. TS-e1964]|nr:MAG: Sir2 histone deacetylase Hst2 [Trizodia sp. TS-e1964]